MLSSDRVRVWLLVAAERPEDAQRDLAPLMKRNKTLPDDHVIVRADIVAGAGFNLIIPVDVPPGEGLTTVVNLIREKTRATSIVTAQVTAPTPRPAVEAHCYIAQDEVGGAYPEEGRYPNSPGANPWG